MIRQFVALKKIRVNPYVQARTIFLKDR